MSLGSELSGCGWQPVTPYMHRLAYHVPNFMLKHGGVKQITGQGNIKLIMILSNLFSLRNIMKAYCIGLKSN